LRNVDSTSDVIARRRRCVLRKDTWCYFGAKQSTRYDGPAWRKTCKQNSFCVGVVWQTQSIVKHLVQTKKIGSYWFQKWLYGFLMFLQGVLQFFQV